MVSRSKEKEFILFALPSDQGFIQQMILQSEKFLFECGVQNTAACAVVLRELCSNAMEHGNQNNVHLTVYCSIVRISETRFVIVVEDQGQGFDYGSLDTALPDDPRTLQRRGYVLVHHICDSIEFNDKGNRVVVNVDLSHNAYQKSDEIIFRIQQYRHAEPQGCQHDLPAQEETRLRLAPAFVSTRMASPCKFIRPLVFARV